MESSSTEPLETGVRHWFDVGVELPLRESNPTLPEREQLAGPHNEPVHVVLGGLAPLAAAQHALAPDGERHGAQRLVHTEPILVLLAVEEVPEVGRPNVGPLNDGRGAEGGVGADARLPVGGGVFEQAEAPGLPWGVAGLPRPLASVVGHAPALARVPRQGDLLLLLPADLITEVRTAGEGRLVRS